MTDVFPRVLMTEAGIRICSGSREAEYIVILNYRRLKNCCKTFFLNGSHREARK